MLDVIGKRYESLVVEKEIEPWILPSGRKQRRMQCLCDCGERCFPRLNDLQSGKATSCGCKRNKSNHNRMFEDLTGNKYARLTVVCRIEDKIKKDGSKLVNWLCRCDCGNLTEATSQGLKRGNIKSCGCYRSESIHNRCFKDLTGQTFAHLYVENLDHMEGKKSFYKCLCDCGVRCVVSREHLVSGHTTSCGHVRSKMEDVVNQYLFNNKYEYGYRKTFPDLIHYYELEVDFVLYQKSKVIAVIECQGRQHYDNVGSFGRLQREITDEIKRQYFLENNIPLYEIRYDENPIQKLKLILDELHVNPVPSSA